MQERAVKSLAWGCQCSAFSARLEKPAGEDEASKQKGAEKGRAKRVFMTFFQPYDPAIPETHLWTSYLNDHRVLGGLFFASVSLRWVSAIRNWINMPFWGGKSFTVYVVVMGYIRKGGQTVRVSPIKSDTNSELGGFEASGRYRSSNDRSLGVCVSYSLHGRVI